MFLVIKYFSKKLDIKKTLELKNFAEINKFCEKCLYLNTSKDFI